MEQIWNINWMISVTSTSVYPKKTQTSQRLFNLFSQIPIDSLFKLTKFEKI